ncbi:MAG: acyl-CoA dehydrogenase family protein [Bryobacteraceae bacterium]|nr:acyl-CoA dehydrogenase family protein [Bryobacteraceae bacterium]
MGLNPEDSRECATLRTLPGDSARQILWRFADRQAPSLKRLVRAARTVARQRVRALVKQGARTEHEWTEQKAGLLQAFDEFGIWDLLLEPRDGGFVEGPKNLALALALFELAWVDAGAAATCLAHWLALAPVYLRGTPEQRQTYLRRLAPRPPHQRWRGAFCLTEPLPYAGADAGPLGGKVRVAEWPQGGEPLLEVDKCGRFITNMAFANLVVAAVDSGDSQIRGSCLVLLEEHDPGVFDRGRPSRTLIPQLASTQDPAFRLRVPARRIVGGYHVRDGAIVPRYDHRELVEAVYRRTRILVGLMTAAKLLSAVEPIIRYQRRRFRGSETAQPGSPLYELGLQWQQDALHRLVDIWAAGEASASLGFAAARLFDELDPLEGEMDRIFSAEGMHGPAAVRAIERCHKEALDGLQSGLECDQPMVRFVLLNALADVLSPACKLWNTGHGAAMMREAVSLLGGAGVSEDCPGFLGHKWMDAQLEAIFEGPEAVQRRQLSLTMTRELFLAQFHHWTAEMRRIAAERPGTGACTLATAMQLWLWTLNYLQKATDAHGTPLYHRMRQGVTFPLADALCWLLAARYLILDVMELVAKAPADPELAGVADFFTDLCHVQSARAAGEVGRICSQLLFGYKAHPAWQPDARETCTGEELLEMESSIPGMAEIAATAQPPKAGPCARFEGLEPFVRLRNRLDACLTGAHLAKDRAAESLKRVVIPETPDYESGS